MLPIERKIRAFTVEEPGSQPCEGNYPSVRWLSRYDKAVPWGIFFSFTVGKTKEVFFLFCHCCPETENMSDSCLCSPAIKNPKRFPNGICLLQDRWSAEHFHPA